MYNQQFCQTQNNISWVQGLNGAKSMQMQPNGVMLLMDSENEGIFYIKTSDNIGMCNLRKFKYQEVVVEEKKEQQFVTREEFDKLLESLGGIDNGK